MIIKVNNITINYNIYGNGKPLILLNPNSSNTKMMIPLAKKLAKYFKVYNVDRRCCGKSQRDCELTYEASAKDIYELITKLKLDKPYIMGLSGGASVALYLSMMYPNSVSKMILCSGVAKFSIFKYPKWTEIIRKLKFIPGMNSSEKFYVLNEKTPALKQVDLAKINAKTLVINGGKKDIVPESEAKYIANNISNAKLLILKEYGHCKYVFHCKNFDDEVLNFLNN